MNNILLVYFSPTGTTKKILKAIVEGYNVKASATVEEIDITVKKFGQTAETITRTVNEAISRADIVFFGAPVHEDKLPPLYCEMAEGFISETVKPCVNVAVYGNVSTGIVQTHMKEMFKGRGFIPVASGSFIGEHSFTHEGLELAAGRPDEEDLAMAREFGGKIYDAVSSGIREVSLPKETLPLMSRVLPEGSAARFTKVPAVDKNLCTSCGMCVYKCPSGAIDRTTYEIDEEKCIRCFACVRVCAVKARKVSLKNAVLVKKVLETAGGKRKEPEWQII
ncbi:MAG: 4Fe-4S binding protein [Lentihominibacter sp.]|jgi:ferredoxin/flavodoxin